jgi:methylated-DNA-[protein]-cysteine S-methyltransferase
MNVYCRHRSPLGHILLVSNDEHVLGVYFSGQKHYPKSLVGHVEDARHPLLKRAMRQLDEYFAGKRQAFDLPVSPQGTEFQRRVWKALGKIDSGKTSTYGELATKLGVGKAARAVGAAVGRNPISIMIPCHRVVGANGRLTGYAGGLKRKASLLALEGGSII